MNFGFRHGNEQALMGRATAGSLAGAMLMRGTETRSRQEISDELDRLTEGLELRLLSSFRADGASGRLNYYATFAVAAKDAAPGGEPRALPGSDRRRPAR